MTDNEITTPPKNDVPDPSKIDFKELGKRADESHLDFHEESNVDPRTTDVAKAIFASSNVPERKNLQKLLPKADWLEIKKFGQPDTRNNPYDEFNNAMRVYAIVNQRRGTHAKDPANQELREHELFELSTMKFMGQLAKYGIGRQK